MKQEAVTETAASPAALDIREPAKWQMAVRVYLQHLPREEGLAWVDGIRLIAQMSGTLMRQKVTSHNAEYCIVCGRKLVDGKPAGTHGYRDEDGTYIPVSYCKPSEITEAWRICEQKEAAIRQAEERAEKAARQAMIDVRSARKASA